MRRGHRLEPVVLAMYGDETGSRVLSVEEVLRVPSATLVHPDHPLVIATPDAIAMPRDGSDGAAVLVEAKTAGSHMRREWGESGSAELPQQYVAQVTWQLGAVRGIGHAIDRADVAVLIGGDDFRSYPIAWDPELFALLLDVAERFWRDHVETDVPPALDGSDAAARYLASKFPREARPMLDATAEADELARDLAAAKREAKALDARVSADENRLRELIGDAEGMRGADWRATWMTPKSGSVDYKGLATRLGATPDLVREFTRPAARRFVFTPPKGEE